MTRPPHRHMPSALIFTFGVLTVLLSACGTSRALDDDAADPELPGKALHCAPEPGVNKQSANACTTPARSRAA